VDLSEESPRLVIDASIERQFTAEGLFITDEAFVNLSLTTPFFSEQRAFVNDAKVSLTNMNSFTVFELTNFDELGNYQLFDNGFTLEEGVDYKLIVNYRGEIYESIEKLVLSTPFTSIEQVSNEDGFDDDAIAVEIAFDDIKGQDSFYFIDLGDANFISIDDEFFTDGEEIKFTYFFEDNVTLDHLFRIFGSNKRFNTYVDALNELGSGDANGPFGTVPFQARGNIVNISNSDNFPFGYFRISEVYPKVVGLVENQNFVED